MTHPDIITKARLIIGRFLRDTQQQRGHTVEYLADRAGISRRTLYKVFNGEGYTVDTFFAVLSALDLRIEIMPKLIEPEQSN